VTGAPLLIQTVAEMSRLTARWRTDGQRVALVATMGYLHEGHLSLVRRAQSVADRVVVSIYVNPTQFGPSEDLSTYPRDLEGDLRHLAALSVDCAFAPNNGEMYPQGFATRVTVQGLTEGLCGRSRPVHFAGVTTIVSKLFHITQPHVAAFGEKDYQQLAVIRRMTRDLNFSIEILPVPTVREPDGLAMSSRNARLSPTQRQQATALSRALFGARQRFRGGERDAEGLVAWARGVIEAESELAIDYLEIVDPDDLRSLSSGPDAAKLPERVHMALAVFAGKTRLIDNLRLSDL
jgi:pantoate--beta-alanine ligase